MSPLHAPTGPISLNGVAAAEAGPNDGRVLVLRVMQRESGSGASVHPHCLRDAGFPESGGLFERDCGSDVVLTLRPCESVPRGTLQTGNDDRLNLHLALFTWTRLRAFNVASLQPLVDVRLEVWLENADPGKEVILDRTALASRIHCGFFGRVFTVGQRSVIEATASIPAVILRVAATNSLDEEARANVSEYHCFRGLFTVETLVELVAPVPTHGGGGPAHCLRLLPEIIAGSKPSRRDSISIETSDGEVFPVRRRILRPCIALASVVLDGSLLDPVAKVTCDSAVFDQVWRFLERVSGHGPPVTYDIRTFEKLLPVARDLGLRSLEEQCLEALGQFQTRLRLWTLDEVKNRNNAGDVLLIIDGMVLDVKRWLPEHPGGSTIIPEQSLNREAAVLFELYHSSRESFMFLKQFYYGELLKDERILLYDPEPRAGVDFLAQLREFTADFRISAEAERSVIRNL